MRQKTQMSTVFQGCCGASSRYIFTLWDGRKTDIQIRTLGEYSIDTVYMGHSVRTNFHY